MRYFSYIVCLICILRFAADNCYEIAYRAFKANHGYTEVRFMETASVLNPTSILIGQAEKNITTGLVIGKRLLFYHPNDFDALIMHVDELRHMDQPQDARKFLFQAAKADPYTSVTKSEMQQLKQ